MEKARSPLEMEGESKVSLDQDFVNPSRLYATQFGKDVRPCIFFPRDMSDLTSIESFY